MIKKVRKIFDEIINYFCWEVEFELRSPPKEIKFDFSTNLPLVVSKKYKILPKKVFEDIKNEILKKFKGIFIDINFSPAGFLNFNLSLNFYLNEIIEIFKNKEGYLKSLNLEDVLDKKLLLEFVSANPTGPLHIGHGRCAVLGDVLGNIFKKLGYDLKKEYYINDRGRQIDVLLASVIDSILKFDDVIVEEKIKVWSQEIIKETKYKGEYINDIAKKLKEKFLEINLKNINMIKKFVIETIMEDIKSSLRSFKVEFDNYFYETSLYDSYETEKIKEILLKKSSKEESLVEYKDGALWFKSQQLAEDDKDRVLIRSNGEPTYFFSDIVYHYNKISRGYNWLINIWGTDHHGYVDRLKGACRTIFNLLGLNYRLDIILYQLVSLIKDGNRISMSTREGNFISLYEVIKEVGSDVTRFFLLTKSPNTHLEFDFDLAKEHSLKNPVYYIQYAHTRCCGILKEIKKMPDKEQLINSIQENCKILKQKEIELIKELCLYSEILQVCIEKFSAHHLCNYLIDLARIFHKFYEDCRVISNDSKVIYYRLFLVIVSKIVLSDALEILGIEAPQRM